MHTFSVHFPGGAWDAGDRRWRLEGESQETVGKGEVSASRFLKINSKGRHKLANISLQIEWLRGLLQAAYPECFHCQSPIVGAFKWQLWVPAACRAGSHSGTARKVIKKLFLLI